MPLGAG
jgi:putative tryptophan/tyrosine transport system substrate-binding protein